MLTENRERFVPTQMTGTVNETYASGLDTIVKYITGKSVFTLRNLAFYAGETHKSD